MRDPDVLLFGGRHSDSGFRRKPKQFFRFVLFFARVVRCYGGFFTACVGLFVPGARHKKAVVVSYRYVRQRRDFRIARRAVLLRRNGAAAFNERKNRRRMQRNYGNAALGRRGVLVGYVRRQSSGRYRLQPGRRFGARREKRREGMLLQADQPYFRRQDRLRVVRFGHQP